MQEFIEEILKKGIPIIGISLQDDCLKYEINGFYKSGSIKIYKKDEKIYADSRYNQTDEIETFEDLVRLNYNWWQYSKDRCEGWTNPDYRWLPHLIEYKFVSEHTEIKTVYK